MKACRALLIGTVGLCGLTIFTSGVARAQEDEAAEEGGGDEPTEGEADGADEAVTDEASDEGAGDETAEEGSKDQEAGDGEAAASASVVETPGKSYQFVGLRYRGIIVPTFMMNLFGEGGDGVYVHAFGPEFAIRKDNFEYNFSIWYADYGMDPTPFKAKDDPIEAYEIVESKLKVLYLTADFLWSTDVSPEFAINYGMGAGLGFVFGDLYRQQAYPLDGNRNTPPGEWVPCAPSMKGTNQFCDNDNDHYGDYSEPSWASGGSKPIVFPWLALQTGLRYKPHPKFVARLDLGFGTSGFFFGLGADYGL